MCALHLQDHGKDTSALVIKGQKLVDYLKGESDFISDVSDSFTWSEMEEYGRNAFYKGREVKRYNDRGDAIFKRPTYNGYLREIGDG
jgi:anaerobic glycerol-3-phosphate dehydrogenase